jgi:hypothetical protein
VSWQYPLTLVPSAGSVTLAKMAASFPYLGLVAAPPTVFVKPFMFDTTAVSGGLYGWDGAAYRPCGGPL